MRRSFAGSFLLPLIPILLTGCHGIGDKAASISVIYAVTAVLSLLLLAGYCSMNKKRDIWYLLLFASVLVVNVGYFALSISTQLGEALLANRLAYFGSVFLPLAMLMIIIQVTHFRFRKWVRHVLLTLSVVMFLIAASQGYLPIYYKEVSFSIVNGVASLQKVYGPLHGLYLVYLLGYFSAMVAIIIHATLRDKIDSLAHAVILAIAVFVNIGVWMIEQLVYIEFEFLSISYIITECFLLGLNIMMTEADMRKTQKAAQETPTSVQQEVTPVPSIDPEQAAMFREGLAMLTPKEQELYQCYVEGMATDVIMEKLNIKENTLKFHSKNLYSKLGVRSRKQLTALHRELNR